MTVKDTRRICEYPNCKFTLARKIHWASKRGLCLLHYERATRRIDLDAPILPAPSPIKLIMKDEEE